MRVPVTTSSSTGLSCAWTAGNAVTAAAAAPVRSAHRATLLTGPVENLPWFDRKARRTAERSVCFVDILGSLNDPWLVSSAEAPHSAQSDPVLEPTLRRGYRKPCCSR